MNVVVGARGALAEMASRAGLLNGTGQDEAVSVALLASVPSPVAASRVALWLDSDPAFALDLGVPVVCSGRWIADLHRDLRPDVPAFVVRPGVGERPPPPAADSGPLRVHVVGDDISEGMSEPHVRVATPAEADVLLDLTPKMLSFRPYATVATLVPGRDEVVEHGVSGLLTEPDDPRGAARLLDLLARDRDLLRRLQEGAREKPWPTLDEAAQTLRDTLDEIAALPPAQPAPDAAPFLAAMPATRAQPQTHPVLERPRLHQLKERLRG